VLEHVGHGPPDGSNDGGPCSEGDSPPHQQPPESTEVTPPLSESPHVPIDTGVFARLETSWQRANQPTRAKFLASILAEPIMLAYARRVIKQGS
jgi:hypothetical protein